MLVDETTGAHTNTTESTWKHVQASLSLYNHKADYIYYLAEYKFRQKCKTQDVDPFCKFDAVTTIDWSNTNSIE
jgi:hypothetical protein